jgi:phospholipase/lecithinase/hemolysin
MPENKIVAHARVQVTLDIPVVGAWGGGCDFAQLHKQAVESALGELRNGLSINGLVSSPSRARVEATVVGAPSVTAIIVTDKL